MFECEKIKTLEAKCLQTQIFQTNFFVNLKYLKESNKR